MYHAVHLARERQETMIEIYGLDLCGSTYCDGSPLNIGDEYFLTPHMNSGESVQVRWKHERDALGEAIRHANKHDIGLVIHP